MQALLWFFRLSPRMYWCLFLGFVNFADSHYAQKHSFQFHSRYLGHQTCILTTSFIRTIPKWPSRISARICSHRFHHFECSAENIDRSCGLCSTEMAFRDFGHILLFTSFILFSFSKFLRRSWQTTQSGFLNLNSDYDTFRKTDRSLQAILTGNPHFHALSLGCTPLYTNKLPGWSPISVIYLHLWTTRLGIFLCLGRHGSAVRFEFAF